jgi:hypothetical protein
MSQLYSIRRNIRDLIVDSEQFELDEILIKRRTNIWNDVAVAAAASTHGQCLVIGVAEGKKDGNARPRKGMIKLEVSIPITLIELPTITPEQPEAEDEDEDDRWEALCLLLQGDSLGRGDQHFWLDMDSFTDVEDDEYIIRQAVFKTRIIIAPQPESP